MSTGTLQRRVLSPLLFTLLTHDCSASVNNNNVIRFTDPSSVVGLITSNDESACREKVELLAAWCSTHNVDLNIKKDQGEGNRFKRTGYQHHLPLIINGSKVERAHSTQFLEIHLTDKLTRRENTTVVVKKAQSAFSSSTGWRRWSSSFQPVQCSIEAPLRAFSFIVSLPGSVTVQLRRDTN